MREIAIGYDNQIRKIKDQEVAEIAILATIETVAKKHGNREQIEPGILLECVELMVERFSNLGINEINEAYKLWSLGETVGMEMWHGEFNLTNFGRVISDYARYRNAAIAALVNKREEIARESRRKAMEQEKAVQVRELFKKGIQDARGRYLEGLKPQTFQDIPTQWYGIAESIGKINFSAKDKKAYFSRALSFTIASVSKEVAQLKSSKRTIEGRTYLKENGQGTDAFKRSQVVNAQKAMMFDCFVLGILDSGV